MLYCTLVIAPAGVPPDAVDEIVRLPAVGVIVILVPATKFLYSSPVAPTLTPSNWLAVPIEVNPVPPVAVVCVAVPDITRPYASVVTPAYVPALPAVAHVSVGLPDTPSPSATTIFPAVPVIVL